MVSLTNPINGTADLELPFLCRSASLPQWSIGEIVVPYFGRQIFIPGDRVFNPWTITVINDEDFKIRNALETWHSAMNSIEGNLATEGSEPSRYKTQATVTQYGKDGTEQRVYQLNGVWPTEIAEIPVDWESQNQFEQYQVTLRFDDAFVVGGASQNTLRK